MNRELSEEARLWTEKANVREKPYGKANLGHGLSLLTAVAEGNAFTAIKNEIYGTGCLRLKIVNPTVRKPPSITVQIKSIDAERIQWKEGSENDRGPIQKIRAIPATCPDEIVAAEDEFSVGFEVVSDGICTIESEPVRQRPRNASSRSIFYVTRRAGTDPDRNECNIVFFLANPDGAPHLALDEEMREIEKKVRSSDHPKALRLITCLAVRPDDLLQYLNQHRPHIVHFSGHGSTAEELVLLDAQRRPQPVGKEALKHLFATLKDNLRIVVLNACFSRAQADAITEVIDCAIGMKRSIGDHASITFAASFYRAIGFGKSVQMAFEQGRAALMLENIPAEDVPELLVRRGVDPNRLFPLIPTSSL